ncbi:lipopolysaccharide biosynthesis protein, partial [Brachybacterium alimentarium]|uniref:lipopolysaccharide biosynthesis protein n=1 Tax=Brachybacterium alimentarium TaxID=47845 RepID=UPI003FCF6335
MKSFLVRMRSHRILHGLVSAQLSTVGGAFIVNVLSARALGPEGRGEVAFFLQLSYLVGALAPLGRDRSVLSVIHGEHGHGADQRTRVPGELLATPVLIATAASLILGIVLAVSTQSAVIAVGFWMLLLGNLGSRFFRSDAIVGHRSSPFVIATLAGQGVLVIAALYLLIEGIGSVGHWIIAYGVAMLLPFLAISFPSQTRLPCAVRGTADKSGEVRRLGVALLPSSLAEMALTKLDRIVLPVLGTFSQLGYYSVAVTLVEFSSMPFRQHVDSRIPVWATRWSEARLYPFRAMFRPLLTAIIITACVSAATAIMIVPIFGESYAPAVGLVPWLA